MATLGITRLRQTPTTYLDGTAPRIGGGTHAPGHGFLTVLFDEFLLELAPHDRNVDDYGEQIHVHQHHQRQSQGRPLVGHEDGDDQNNEGDRDEELAEVESGVDIIANVDTPWQTRSLGTSGRRFCAWASLRFGVGRPLPAVGSCAFCSTGSWALSSFLNKLMSMRVG